MASGGSGPARTTGSSDPLASVAGAITPARATHSLDLDVPVGSKPVVVVGAPSLQLTYSGTTPAGGVPTRIFAQIVDDTSGLVLGNQVTPIAVTLDGAQHTATVPLEIVAYAGKPGDRLTLQLVATTVAYATPRLGGTITFSGIGSRFPPRPSGPADPNRRPDACRAGGRRGFGYAPRCRRASGSGAHASHPSRMASVSALVVTFANAISTAA